MSSVRKGSRKVEVGLKWDPSPIGEPPHDLDIIAATYTADDPHGSPAYLVHFDSRSPDGTIVLNRDSRTGQGFGFDEVMTLELDRLDARYARVVVGVLIQQPATLKVFADVPSTAVRIRDEYAELVHHDFAEVAGCTAATVAEFTRRPTGEWAFREVLRGFAADPSAFAAAMGSAL
ncbi:TerD family protein [Actinomycetota bacterium Odt1-20B]